MTTARLCTFTIGNLAIGIDVESIQEIVRGHELTPVPLAAPYVAGLLNLRGQIITAIDARRRLEIHDAPPATGERVDVIVRSSTESVSLVVDREGDVVDVDAQSREDIPETVNSTIRSFTTGAYQLEGVLLLVLDTDRALSLSAAGEGS